MRVRVALGLAAHEGKRRSWCSRHRVPRRRGRPTRLDMSDLKNIPHRRPCGTPGCTSYDQHPGPCTCWEVTEPRKRGRLDISQIKGQLKGAAIPAKRPTTEVDSTDAAHAPAPAVKKHQEVQPPIPAPSEPSEVPRQNRTKGPRLCTRVARLAQTWRPPGVDRVSGRARRQPRATQGWSAKPRSPQAAPPGAARSTTFAVRSASARGRGGAPPRLN